MLSGGHTPFYSASRGINFLVSTLRRNNKSVSRAYTAIVTNFVVS
jgi:hypothetical protein